MIRSPRRRFAAVAAAGLLAVGFLAACRTDARTAAYVGDTRITDEQVSASARSIPAKTLDTPSARLFAVSELTFNQIAAKYAAAKGYGVAPITDAALAEAAQELQVPNDPAKYPAIDMRAASNEWTSLLLQKQPATQPSDADLQALYQELLATGTITKTATFDQVKPALLQVPNVTQALSLRKDLLAAMKGYNVEISPRYANDCAKAPCSGLSVPLAVYQPGDGSQINIVVLPLTPANTNPATIDLPATPSPQS